MSGSNRLVCSRLYNRNAAFRGVRGGLVPFTVHVLSSFTSFTSHTPSQSPPTIPAHTPSSSAPVYPTRPILAHSLAVYYWEATQTSKETLLCTQSLKAVTMANPLAGLFASKQCTLPNATSCARSRSREVMRTGRASPAWTTTSGTCYNNKGQNV